MAIGQPNFLVVDVVVKPEVAVADESNLNKETYLELEGFLWKKQTTLNLQSFNDNVDKYIWQTNKLTYNISVVISDFLK